MIVIDASATLELLLRTPAGDLVEQRIFSHEETLHAPHLIDLEIAQVLRRYAVAGDMVPLRGQLLQCVVTQPGTVRCVH